MHQKKFHFSLLPHLGSILDSQLSKIEPRSAHIMQLRPPTHPGHQLEIGSLFCVSLSVPTFMSVFTNYVCPLLLCLSPPFLSVPTFYVCPQLKKIQYYFANIFAIFATLVFNLDSESKLGSEEPEWVLKSHLTDPPPTHQEYGLPAPTWSMTQLKPRVFHFQPSLFQHFAHSEPHDQDDSTSLYGA